MESTNRGDDAKGKDKRWAKEERRRDDKKWKKQDQVKKMSEGEDAYIQQLFGAEKSQANRCREEK